MIPILRIPPLPDPLIRSEEYSVMFDDEPSWKGMTALWRITLAMALRDDAASVHFHPWSERVLSYEVKCHRWEMVPTPRCMAH